LIPWLARIPERIGYSGEGRSALLTRSPRQPGRDLPMIERYLRLLQSPGAVSEIPRLVMSPERSGAVLRHFGLSPDRPILALCPGAEYGPAKRWPAAHFARLAELLHERDARSQIVVLGSGSERALAEEIAAASGAPVRCLAGSTTLDEVIALLAHSAGVVTNDSGLMHIAAALGRPQVAIFGSSDPRHTPPRSARAQVLWLHLECSPCFQRVCPLGHLNCLRQITPDQVRTALDLAIVS
jgi:heptosyltransferase-2